MKRQSVAELLFQIFIKPNAQTEDDHRRAYILHILITGTIALSSLAFLSSAITKLTRHTHYAAVPLIVMAMFVLFFSALLYISKRGYFRFAAIAYVVVFTLMAMYPIVLWGILLPQGILTLCLIIVMSGVLLNARASFIMTILITAVLLGIEYLGITGVLHFDTAWMHEIGGYNDVVVYGITFSIVALVCWLSNRQIEHSLHRARASEQALRKERNRLEVRVRERTKELERMQVEKLGELNRFAEFGRISSTLLHELANPLTSAILNLELIKNERTSKLYDHLHESITYMDEYVSSARRQLRRESEVGDFNVAEEIGRVVGFLQPKAHSVRVGILTTLDERLTISGDSVKFNQIISNLLANAIDAYEPLLAKANQPINVNTKQIGMQIQITITDFGIGIPPKDLAHVFEPFYTTKPSDRGTGLGLTITKRAVEEDFVGTITATSTKRGGTRFTIRIPIR